MGPVVEISLVTESDRAEWEALARAHNGHFGTVHTDDVYERTWRRLLDDERLRGVVARLGGRAVGLANYLFHAGVWYRDKCYLADLYVIPEVRRRGIATTVIEWVARDAEHHGYPSLYWNTLEDSPARALYDRVAKHQEGLIHYGYRRDLRA
jgi:GNAT superfamily N-acetyltransferase